MSLRSAVPVSEPAGPQELGISPRTVETYHEHIKLKLGYCDANALRRGAREWFELNHR